MSIKNKCSACKSIVKTNTQGESYCANNKCILFMKQSFFVSNDKEVSNLYKKLEENEG
jgi:hypothetical protein